MDGLKKLYIMITYAKSFDSTGTCFDSNVPIFMHRNTIFTYNFYTKYMNLQQKKSHSS